MQVDKTNTSVGYLLGRLFSFADFIETSFRASRPEQTPLLERMLDEAPEHWSDFALAGFKQLENMPAGARTEELLREATELQRAYTVSLAKKQLQMTDLIQVLRGYQHERKLLQALTEGYIDVPGYRGPERRQRKQADLPLEQWFDPAVFLATAKQHINVMYGNRWSAFSMSDGMVYLQTALVFDIIREMGRKRRQTDFSGAVLDDQMRQNVLQQALAILSQKDGVVAVDLLPSGAHCGFFDLTMEDGTNFMRCSYVPFRITAFNLDPDRLEKGKYGRIKCISQVLPSLS